jgi:hypothetical protein
MEGHISWQQRLAAILARAHSARSEPDAQNIMAEFEGASARDVVQEAQRLYPGLLDELYADADTNLEEVLPKIALTLFDKSPYEASSDSESESDSGVENGASDDEYEHQSDSSSESDEEYHEGEQAEATNAPAQEQEEQEDEQQEEEEEEEEVNSRKRKDAHEPDDIRRQIRALKPIFTTLNKENQDCLRNLIGLEQLGADLDQMRNDILALEPAVASIKEEYQPILSGLIRFFKDL